MIVGVTEQKLLGDIYDVTPLKRKTGEQIKKQEELLQQTLAVSDMEAKVDEKRREVGVPPIATLEQRAGAPRPSVPRPLNDEQVDEAEKELLNTDYVTKFDFPEIIFSFLMRLCFY